MARAAKLKVYRTPIGFHDAYVAAPSQKAALAAWGSDANLFARGVAEEITDPALTAEPLAHPGEVVKRLRGTAAEQFAALPPDAPKRVRADPAQQDDPAPTKARKAAPPPPPKPKPDRVALDAAEQALAAAERRHRTEDRELAAREAELARERRALADRQEAEAADLEAERNRARAAYDRAMAAWRA